MDRKCAANRSEVTCFILSWQQVVIGQNCPEIHLHYTYMYILICVTDPLVSTETSTMPEWSGVRMPPGELSHWAPLEGCEMLFPCPIVAFHTERTKQELCLCPHLLLTLQPATVVNRNTAVSLHWAHVWSLQVSPAPWSCSGSLLAPFSSLTAVTSLSWGPCPDGRQ